MADAQPHVGAFQRRQGGAVFLCLRHKTAAREWPWTMAQSQRRTGKTGMDRFSAEPTTTFSQPIRQIVFMLVATALVAAGAWVIKVTSVIGATRAVTRSSFNSFDPCQMKGRDALRPFDASGRAAPDSHAPANWPGSAIALRVGGRPVRLGFLHRQSRCAAPLGIDRRSLDPRRANDP